MLVRSHDEPGGVRVLTLDRPPANALTASLLVDLKEAVGAAATDDAVRAVVVRGNEKFFCAGLDLKELASGGAGDLAGIGREDGIFALWTLPKPTVAEVAGHAVAGGAIICLACDVRLTCEGRHRIGLNENAFGIAFPREAFEIARSGLPHHRLRRLILEGGLHSPGDARTVGYVDEVLEDTDALRARALEVATAMAAYPAPAYAHNKRLILEGALGRCEEESEEAREALLGLWTHPETLMGIMARVASLGSN